MTDEGTGRTDWDVRITCPEDEDHMELESTAKNAEPSAEDCFTMKRCPICGAKLDRDFSEEPTSVGV